MKINRLTNPGETFDDVADIVRAAELLAEVYGRYDRTGQGVVPPEIKSVRRAFVITCRALNRVMMRYSRNVSKIIEAAETEPVKSQDDEINEEIERAWKYAKAD